jgi:hypothetical protein
MAKLDEGQRKDFIAGYTKLLTAAWSADDFDAFMANLNGNPAGVTAEYGLPMPATGSIEIRTQSDGGESLDQAVELWEHGGSYTMYVIHDDHIESVNLAEISGAGTYCCSCCPCCTCT